MRTELNGLNILRWQRTGVWLKLLVSNMNYGATVAALAGYGHHTLWFVRYRQGQRGAHYCRGCVAGLLVRETRLIVRRCWFCRRAKSKRGTGIFEYEKEATCKCLSLTFSAINSYLQTPACCSVHSVCPLQS